jgi:soluble lytic murein transglycosylase-like protein
MVDSVKTNNPNRFFNKYVEYRRQYDEARNFDKALQAKEVDKPKSEPAAVASKKSETAASQNPTSDNPTTKLQKTGTATSGAAAPEAPSVAPMASASGEISVPDAGPASNRMMDRVKQYEPHIRAAAARYNIDPNWIAGVIWQESRGNPRAVSHCGAMGLMQLMPGTARSLGVSNAFDIAQNIDGGAKYLRQMLDTFRGNMSFATAAYNAGPGNVMKHGGIPPFRETRDYVPHVLGYANGFKVANAFEEQGPTSAVRV